jgi:hypothetical protein
MSFRHRIRVLFVRAGSLWPSQFLVKTQRWRRLGGDFAGARLSRTA